MFEGSGDSSMNRRALASQPSTSQKPAQENQTPNITFRTPIATVLSSHPLLLTIKQILCPLSKCLTSLQTCFIMFMEKVINWFMLLPQNASFRCFNGSNLQRQLLKAAFRCAFSLLEHLGEVSGVHMYWCWRCSLTRLGQKSLLQCSQRNKAEKV